MGFNELEHVKIQYEVLLGEHIGMLKGICTHPIPEKLKEDLEKYIIATETAYNQFKLGQKVIN